MAADPSTTVVAVPGNTCASLLSKTVYASAPAAPVDPCAETEYAVVEVASVIVVTVRDQRN